MGQGQRQDLGGADAAQRAAYEIDFIPAMRDDTPTAVWLALPLTFSIR